MFKSNILNISSYGNPTFTTLDKIKKNTDFVIRFPLRVHLLNADYYPALETHFAP
jgi:hypothetical protein